jgi:hypothetical protein
VAETADSSSGPALRSALSARLSRALRLLCGDRSREGLTRGGAMLQGRLRGFGIPAGFGVPGGRGVRRDGGIGGIGGIKGERSPSRLLQQPLAPVQSRTTFFRRIDFRRIEHPDRGFPGFPDWRRRWETAVPVRPRRTDLGGAIPGYFRFSVRKRLILLPPSLECPFQSSVWDQLRGWRRSKRSKRSKGWTRSRGPLLARRVPSFEVKRSPREYLRRGLRWPRRSLFGRWETEAVRVRRWRIQ